LCPVPQPLRNHPAAPPRSPQAAHAHPPLGGDREHSAIAALRHNIAVYGSALPTRSASAIAAAATLAAITPRDARPPRRAGPPATGGGRQNRRFGATALPITLYVHSSALPTRSPSTTTTAATPSPSAPNARPPRRAGPTATGRRSREQALHRRHVAPVGLRHGDGLVKPCWYRVSVTPGSLGPAEISVSA
jgi:hypothetical protein